MGNHEKDTTSPHVQYLGMNPGFGPLTGNHQQGIGYKGHSISHSLLLAQRKVSPGIQGVSTFLRAPQ